MIIDQCSIDSLLERTIKHMLFLQSITKHADKLNKSADIKVNAFGKSVMMVQLIIRNCMIQLLGESCFCTKLVLSIIFSF